VARALLDYLERANTDWRAAVAFYDCTQDRLMSWHRLEGGALQSTALDLPISTLPLKLVRKFFQHALVAEDLGKRLVLNLIFRTSPYYEADPMDRESLAPIVPVVDWKSCICMPLADSEDIFALLILASHKRNSFSSRDVSQILPLTSVAAMAMAQHVYRAEKGRLEEEVKTASARIAAEVDSRMSGLIAEKDNLTSQIESQARTITDLLDSMSHLDRDSEQYREELGRLQMAIFALEEQSSAATEHLSGAYDELTKTSFDLAEANATISFLRAAGEVLAEEHETKDLPITLLSWYCNYFGIDRFSLMVPDPSGEVLSIAVSRGIQEDVVRRVQMRIGHGIAGWVAGNRRPLLVQSRQDSEVQHTDQDRYNSDSFLCIPLVYRNQLFGVVNFSNKRDGSIFTQSDLDRATALGNLLSVTLPAARLSGSSRAYAA
jgi:GAF domain-containing protein